VTYEVLCTNIGSVYSGSDYAEASTQFNAYVIKSRERWGCVANETVTMLVDGEIMCESDGSLYAPTALRAPSVDTAGEVR
jgi:hypothetical protein